MFRGSLWVTRFVCPHVPALYTVLVMHVVFAWWETIDLDHIVPKSERIFSRDAAVVKIMELGLSQFGGWCLAPKQERT